MKSPLMRTTRVALAVLVVDQLSKLLVRWMLAPCTAPGAVGCERAGFLGRAQLLRVANAGSALGFQQGLWIWIPVAAAGVVLIVWYLRGGRTNAAVALAAGLQLGGGVGNLADRMLLGEVTDFLYLGAGPVFNVADVALAVGTVLAARSLARGIDRPAEATLGAMASVCGDSTTKR